MTDEITGQVNDQLVLISGESGTGKSASLMNLKNQEGWIYLNCEAGKRLPFRNKFESYTVTDPYQIYEGIEHITGNPNYTGAIIDTVTFLMEMFESTYIVGSSDTQKGWLNYFQFFKNLMQKYIAGSDKSFILLGHTLSVYDEKSMGYRTTVPVKGALKNNGLEAYFSTVVSAKKIPIRDLKGMDPELLHITPQDEAVGYKHVFQTQITKDTVGERIRSPLGMFAPNQTYMDNDCQLLLNHLGEYYR